MFITTLDHSFYVPRLQKFALSAIFLVYCISNFASVFALFGCLGVPLVPCLVHAAGEGEKGDPCNNLPREEDGGDLLMQALCLDKKNINL